ncbi:hypothetical protein GCM10027214_33920 [Stenotrophomonas tumulicola]
MLALFCVPINKPATSCFIVLAGLAALGGSDTRARWQQAWHDPLAKGMLAWALVLLASALHALLTARDGSALYGSSLWTFVLPLVIASLLQTPQQRWRALHGFAAGVTLVMLASWLMAAGLLPQPAVAELTASMRNTVFKEYTQQGLATLLLASFALSWWALATTRRQRGLAVGIAALSLLNVILLLSSRTSYLAAVPLLLYWLWVLWRASTWQWRLHVPAVALCLIAGVTTIAASNIGDRLVHSVTSEVARYTEHGDATSSGTRLWLWQHTVDMAASNPLFGQGLGQWRTHYQARMHDIHGAAPFLLAHPHQEYLLVLAEEGALGLCALLVLLVLLARLIHRLPVPERHFFTSVLIVYVVAGLGNGLVSDYTHRNTFVLLLSCMPAVATWARRNNEVRDHG